MRTPNTLILGLGNRLRHDDAAGIVAAEQIAAHASADCLTGAASGLAVLDHLAGYQRAILIDATSAGQDAPGTVRRWSLAERPGSRAPRSAHELGLAELLGSARRFGVSLPPEVVIYTVEAEHLATWGEGLSSAVADGVSRLVRRVLDDHFAGGRNADRLGGEP